MKKSKEIGNITVSNPGRDPILRKKFPESLIKSLFSFSLLFRNSYYRSFAFHLSILVLQEAFQKPLAKSRDPIVIFPVTNSGLLNVFSSLLYSEGSFCGSTNGFPVLSGEMKYEKYGLAVRPSPRLLLNTSHFPLDDQE